MRKFGISWIVVALTVVAPVEVRAQDASGPRAALDQLFLGMRMGNSAVAREVLAPDVRFAVIEVVDGVTSIESQTLDDFHRSVGVSGGAWNEQIYDVEVQVDDAMASVWAPYTFYLNGRISHCGINSIELLRDDGGWKITQISDTRRTERCPDPLGGR
jgi:hypothetical protein